MPALIYFCRHYGSEWWIGKIYILDGRHIFTNPAPVIDPNTTWEKVESKNIGLDFGFFGNALTGTLDIFQRDTKDMLGPTVDFPICLVRKLHRPITPVCVTVVGNWR